jgi:hypothetical protein
MAADGFVLGGFEAKAIQAGIWNALPPPFVLKGVRPDAWGLRTKDSLFAFAEAKAANDIDNKHTRSQLRVFGHTKMRSNAHQCPLYIAIPWSAAYVLDHVLIDLGLISARHIVRLHVPEVLLEH